MKDQKGWEMEDIAGRVWNVASEILQSIESGQLNQAVKDTMGQALDEAKGQMEQYRDKLGSGKWSEKAVTNAPREEEKKPFKLRVKWRGRVSGILFTIFGGIGTGIFGLSALGVLILALSLETGAGGWWAAAACGAIAAGSGVMLWAGIAKNGRIGRLKRYVEELKRRGKPYCEIEELSKSCGGSREFVVKDLQKITSLGMLPDVRMDEEHTWLLLDGETYRQYQMYRQSRQQRIEEERQRETSQRTKENGAPKGETAVDGAIRQGEEYRKELDRLRESMPGEPIQEKLILLDSILEHLFEALKKHPEQLDELEKFMEYYLPTTVKLVSTYQEFAAVEFPGENIAGAKAEIRQTLDTINGAFQRLVDDMYEDTAFDAITDASVLQTMLAREGMAQPDFSYKK